MAITSRDQLINALANNSSRIIIDKASLANTAAGQIFSMWRATGQPGQGAIPGAAAVCDHTLLGSMGFTQQVLPVTSYGGYLQGFTTNNLTNVEIHDRLVHMGGLNGTLTTAQTVGIDLSTLLGTGNLAERIGDANYSDVTWWLEWYTDTGATASNATIAVTYNDGTTGNLPVVAVGGTVRAGRMIPLNGLAAAGKYIRAVNNVTLSASTATAGSFGVTASRQRMVLPCVASNLSVVMDWAMLGLPEIFNSSCLYPVVVVTTTTTGAIRAQGKIIHG